MHFLEGVRRVIGVSFCVLSAQASGGGVRPLLHRSFSYSRPGEHEPMTLFKLLYTSAIPDAFRRQAVRRRISAQEEICKKPATAKAEAKPKPKKAPAKPKKAKEVEKAKPEEKAPEAPAENGEAKAEEEAPATDAAEEKDEAAE
ncbi:hypothetical protein FQN60_000315 [Etheostoma spectabile]|uniref:Uncharacterized protein n=1 Tax=Etheostoma spectabile TaxID=54343 RepID=A0A5J5CZ90_9PERO|nr:hypothetical protein FQN60_000315 [Etheostoma spectabile]